MLQNRFEALREARKNGESGFTLIELLIVIIVLGILAGMVVFGVGAFRKDAAAAACSADAKTVSVAASAYNAKYNKYPSQAELTSATENYIEAWPTSTGFSYDAATGKAKCA